MFEVTPHDRVPKIVAGLKRLVPAKVRVFNSN